MNSRKNSIEPEEVFNLEYSQAFEENSEELIEPKDYQSLTRLIRLNLNKSSHYSALLEKIESVAPSPSRDRIRALYRKRVENAKLLDSPTHAIKGYERPDIKALVKQQVAHEYNAMPASKLIDQMVEFEIERRRIYQVIRYYEQELNSIRDAYDSLCIQQLEAAKARQKGRARLHEKNHQALVSCIEKVKKENMGKLVGIDYIRFKELASDCPPPYIPNKRIAGENKDLSTTRRRELLNTDKRSKWAESSLRKFFFDYTGVKPTTKSKIHK